MYGIREKWVKNDENEVSKVYGTGVFLHIYFGRIAAENPAKIRLDPTEPAQNCKMNYYMEVEEKICMIY